MAVEGVAGTDGVPNPDEMTEQEMMEYVVTLIVQNNIIMENLDDEGMGVETE
jgi:hypothetical protein